LRHLTEMRLLRSCLQLTLGILVLSQSGALQATNTQKSEDVEVRVNSQAAPVQNRPEVMTTFSGVTSDSIELLDLRVIFENRASHFMILFIGIELPPVIPLADN
jgi:hypothetical protein